jgi:hypothetical protein
VSLVGSSATREHAWSDARLLGSFGCEKISPRLLRATSSGSAKQVFSTFDSLDQRIPMDYIGFLWTLLDSALIGAYPLILSLTDFPTVLFCSMSLQHISHILLPSVAEIFYQEMWKMKCFVTIFCFKWLSTTFIHALFSQNVKIHFTMTDSSYTLLGGLSSSMFRFV